MQESKSSHFSEYIFMNGDQEVEDVYKNTDQDPKHIADMIHTNYLAFWGLN